VKKAIFKSTGSALFVSYVIAASEPMQDCQTRKVLVYAMEALESITKRQQQWLEQLIGERSEEVNFEGLAPDDVRAQCAMVTQSVINHLPEPEMRVVHARFIPTMVEDLGRDPDGTRKKRLYFSEDRGNAIKWLARWEGKKNPQICAEAMEFLVAKVFVNHSLTDISFRQVAEKYGQSHMVYHRAYKKIKARLKELEDLAILRLTPYFQETMLVGFEGTFDVTLSATYD
jgi:hypothetical protein